MINDVGVAHLGVYARKLLERINGSFDEEGHETEFHVILLLEFLSVLLA